MKYKKILFYVSIFLIVNLSLSCNENLTEPEHHNSFFPLKVGNKWFYNSFNYNIEQFNPQNINVIKTITGTLEIIGKTFYTLETTYFNNNDSVRYKDTSYYYFSDDTLYNYVKDGTNNSYFPGIPLIFSYEQGEKYSCRIGKEGFEITYEVIISEKNDKQIKFFFYIFNARDSEHWIIFNKGTGIYEMFSPSAGVTTRLIRVEL